MPPKAAAGKTAAPEVPKGLLDALFPPWSDAEHASVKPEADGEKFEDPHGKRVPAALEPYIDVWKRPEKLVNGLTDVPVAELSVDPEDEKAPRGGETGRKTSVDLFAGNDTLEWLLDVMLCIKEYDATIAKGSYLFESIYPKGGDGLPVASPTGRYNVRCFVMDQWRCVTVDDMIPVDLFGRTVLVGSRPLVTWPLILTKAVLKLMDAYGILDRASCAQVPAEIWLTGWVQEKLGRSANEGSLLDGVLYDRIDRSLPVAESAATCALIERAAPDRPPPRMIVLCGPSGVGKGAFMRRLVDEMGDIFGACTSHTTRKPKEHEIVGDPCNGYHFVSRDSFEADVAEELFLEHMCYDSLSKENFLRYANQLYGTALATVRDIAAVGKLCLVGVDHRGIASLKARPGVDCLTIYIAPPSEEELERRLRGRFHEAESTIQKRLEWAAAEMEQGIEKEKHVEMGKDAKGKDAKAKGGEEKGGIFDFVLDNTNMDKVYMALKEAIANISPVIRNRLRGLPAYVLDYSDLIPANSVEEAFNKPIAIAGPVTTEKKELFKMLVEEFEGVFGFAPLTTTMKEEDFVPDKILPEEMQRRKYVTDEEFDQLVKEGKLIEHRSSLFIHETLMYRMGTHIDDVKSVVETDQRICLIDCEVEGAMQVQASGEENMTIFLMPPSVEEYEVRVRKWLSYTDEQVGELMGCARSLAQHVEGNSDFDVTLVNDTFDEAYQSFKDVISRYRPDIIPPPEEREVEVEETKPVILCGPTGVGRDSVLNLVRRDLPEDVLIPVAHTTRAKGKGEEDGVHYNFTDKKTMLEMINAGEMAEFYEFPASGEWPPEGELGTEDAPIKTEPTGDLFGTRLDAIKEVTTAGKACLIQTDIASAAKFKETELGSVCTYLYLAPPSYEELERRLKRNREEDMDDQVFHDRLVRAKMDVQVYEASYESMFDFVIVNDDLPSAYCELRRILAENLEPLGTVPQLPASLVLTGPFGPSKQQLIRRMCEAYPDVFATPLVHTTREPRILGPLPGEEGEEGEEGEAKAEEEAPPEPAKSPMRSPTPSKSKESPTKGSKESPKKGGAAAPASEEEEEEEEEPPKEEDGVHFHFRTREDMERMMEEGRFLPGAGDVVVPTTIPGGDDDVQIYGVSYSSIAAIAAEGKICIIGVDSIEEARALRELETKPRSFRAKFAFANHPSEDVVRSVLEASGLAAGTEAEVVERQVNEAWELVSAEGAEGMADDGSTFDRIVDWNGDEDAQYMEIVDSLSEDNPKLIPTPSVWGYGRSLWDVDNRTYGQRPLRVVILGPAASGKSTQAFKLCEEFGVPYVNMGELVQQEVRAKTKLGLEMKKFLDSTQVVPNNPILEIMKRRLFQPDCMKRGYVMDGFPHRDEQWAAMDAYGVAPDKVIILESEFETLVARVEGRRIDPMTGLVYHLENAPPVLEDGETVDMEVADRLTVRHDDSEKNVRNRLKIYDHADAVLRSGFAPVSKAFAGDQAIGDLYSSIRNFVMVEDILKDEVKLVPTRTLEKLQFEVVQCEKFQRKCCLKLRQADGKRSFWCDLADVAGNTSHIHVSYEPDSFACRHEVQHLDLTLPTQTEVIYVESLEPVNLLCSLAVGIQTLFRTDIDPAVVAAAEEARLAAAAAAEAAEAGEDGEAPVASEPAEPDAPSLKLAAPALVFVQPRGSGGDRVMEMLLNDFPLKFARAAKHTTRTPEEGEVDDGSLIFATADAIDAEDILERVVMDHNGVVGEDGDIFATSLSSAQAAASPPLPAQPRMAVIETTVAGARACRARGLDALYVFVQPHSELSLDSAIREELDRLRNPGEPMDEDLAMARIKFGIDETAGALASDSPFDHVIRNTLDLQAYRELKAYAAARWPRTNEPHECHINLELFSWADGEPPKVVMRRHTPTNVASMIPLMRGRHLLKMTCSDSHVYDASFRSKTDFELGDAADMLTGKEGVFCKELTGDYAEQEAGAWQMLFRQRFSVPELTTVYARLYINDPIVSQYCHLRFVDNDTGAVKTCPSGLCLEALSPNSSGYTLLCYASFVASAAAGSWRLAFASSTQLPMFEPVPNAQDYRFEGKYDPNKKAFLSRHVVRVRERCQLALHYETNLPCKYELTVREPDPTLGEFDEAPGLNEPVLYTFDGCKSPFLQASLSLDGPKPLVEGEAAPADSAPAAKKLDKSASKKLDKSKSQKGGNGDGERVYVVQARLQPHLNGFEIHPNGNLLDDVYADPETGLSWKLACYVTENAEVAADDARDAWHQRMLAKWNAEGQFGKDRPKKAMEVLTRVEDIAAKRANVAAYEVALAAREAAAAEAAAAAAAAAADGTAGEEGDAAADSAPAAKKLDKSASKLDKSASKKLDKSKSQKGGNGEAEAEAEEEAPLEAPEPPPVPSKPGRAGDEFFSEPLELPVASVARARTREESADAVVLGEADYAAREEAAAKADEEVRRRAEAHAKAREDAAAEREVLKGRTASEFAEWRASMLAQRAAVEEARAALFAKRAAALAEMSPAPAAEGEEAGEAAAEAAGADAPADAAPAAAPA